MFDHNDTRDVVTVVIFAAALVALAVYNYLIFGGAA